MYCYQQIKEDVCLNTQFRRNLLDENILTEQIGVYFLFKANMVYSIQLQQNMTNKEIM